MYYNRKISSDLSRLIENGGELRWLFDFVKNREDLDFLISKNKSKECISIYRGLSKILIISKSKNAGKIFVDGDKAYKSVNKDFYGEKSICNNFKKELEYLVNRISQSKKFDQYYDNRQEGYYQNILSRKFGICGNKDGNFVIIDKEVVIGYENQEEKKSYLSEISEKYEKLPQDDFFKKSTRYNKKIEKIAVATELDFLALDKKGNILLIEYKHGTNTSGIYYAPIQLGMYFDIFQRYPKGELANAVFEMLAQKQEIGLINPQWIPPEEVKEIIPVLIISEYNYKSSAQEKFKEIINFSKKKLGSEFLENILTYNYTENTGLLEWNG